MRGRKPCRRCEGKPYRYDWGCASCDDSGWEPESPDLPSSQRPSLVPDAAIESAVSAVKRALSRERTGMEWHEKGRVARLLVEGLVRQHGAPLRMLQKWTRLDLDAARRVAGAYLTTVEAIWVMSEERSAHVEWVRQQVE
jgi:hypothetical protein